MNTNIIIVKQEKGSSIFTAISKACNATLGFDANSGINDVRIDAPMCLKNAEQDTYWLVTEHNNPHDGSYNTEVQFRIYDDCVITLEHIANVF